MNLIANPGGIFSKHFMLVALQLEDELDVVIRIAGGDVHVKMENRLAGDLPVVGKDVKAIEFQTADDRSRDNLRGVKYVVQILFGNGKEV